MNNHHYFLEENVSQEIQKKDQATQYETTYNQVSQMQISQLIEQYNPTQIPPNWNIAELHGKANQVGIALPSSPLCPCCNLAIQKKQLSLLCNPMELSFLGPGLPLFYNFLKYCIFLLFELVAIKSGYNISTNIMGNYCGLSQGNKLECPRNWLIQISIANKLDEIQFLFFQDYLALCVTVVVMLTLLLFRKNQTEIDIQVDLCNLTPGDYTVCVKNIPKSIQVDYQSLLIDIFEQYGLQQDSSKYIKVEKVNLVFDNHKIVELEHQYHNIISEKQNHLHENFYEYDHPKLQAYDDQLQKIKLKMNEEAKNSKFAGIAFVSFQTEQMKTLILNHNPYTINERVKTFLNSGKTPELNENDLAIEGQKLFIEQAPEPNDIDWEFIHHQTGQKIKLRILTWILTASFMVGCFLTLYFISLWKKSMIEKCQKEHKEGIINEMSIVKINLLSFIISWVIVLFNKFVIGKVLHIIADWEKISNKTQFNIIFSRRLAVVMDIYTLNIYYTIDIVYIKYSIFIIINQALFLNTAVLSYVIDILIEDNIIGQGGFIQNETQVFILNALFPPVVWLIDPWSIMSNFSFKKEKQNMNYTVLTQKEANLLSEHPAYAQSKRYADIIKTMWFSFFYCTAIPIGPIISIFGLFLYYYIDKYNVLYRRTIKENVSKELSIEMIEMLELIIFFQGFGSITLQTVLQGIQSWQSILIIVASIIYAILPMQQITESLFNIEQQDETATYQEAKKYFQSDYDQLNPVTNKRI